MVFKRRRAPSTVVILTNYHLLVGNEDLSQHDAIYGWITRYCPRQRVWKVSLETKISEIILHVSLHPMCVGRLLWIGCKSCQILPLPPTPRMSPKSN